MEEQKNSPEESLPSGDEMKIESTPQPEEGKIGIETKIEDLDQNATNQNSLITNFQLNDELKAEIKSLLKEDLNTSVSALIEDVKKEGQEVKKDFLTIFGLFASFVTFLSIEVQLFKNKDNIFELLGISSISLAFVMFFALIINDIAKDKSQWSDFKKPTYIINLVFILVGVMFLFAGGCSSTTKIESLEKQTISDSLNIISLRQQVNNLTNHANEIDTTLKEVNKKQAAFSDSLKAKR